VIDCWNGQEPEHRTWMEKSISRGVVLLRWVRNLSFRSLLTPMSWNIRCSLDVYSKPQVCCEKNTDDVCARVTMMTSLERAVGLHSGLLS